MIPRNPFWGQAPKPPFLSLYLTRGMGAKMLRKAQQSGQFVANFATREGKNVARLLVVMLRVSPT